MKAAYTAFSRMQFVASKVNYLNVLGFSLRRNIG